MNRTDRKYSSFSLCREMMETPDIILNFDESAAAYRLAKLADVGKPLLLTGEGSSRIFPAKRARNNALVHGFGVVPRTEGSTQAMEFSLSGYTVLGASNSGRTRELVRLFRKLKSEGHRSLGALTAFRNTPLEASAEITGILACGAEEAVAATKSVVEQALVWQAVLAQLNGESFPDRREGADFFRNALSTDVPPELIDSVSAAETVYFAGRNNGVAEELALKAKEIVRKPSVFIEGTLAVHGVEEVVRKNDVFIVVDPFPDEEEKFRRCLVRGAGAKVFALASRNTVFPTILLPEAGEWNEYTQLAAGWNLLVEAGLAAGLDIDKPDRARKVGNEID